MDTFNPISGEQLAGALDALDVQFVQGELRYSRSLHERPTELIAALACSGEARLRLALIPLFLTRPEFSHAAAEAASNLNAGPRLTLLCYYTAAVWLAQIRKPPANSLPDVFSQELGLDPTDDPQRNLKDLADRHRFLSGNHLNWLGTYHHAARGWFKMADRST